MTNKQTMTLKEATNIPLQKDIKATPQVGDKWAISKIIHEDQLENIKQGKAKHLFFMECKGMKTVNEIPQLDIVLKQIDIVK